jgi:hypothetical protein
VTTQALNTALLYYATKQDLDDAVDETKVFWAEVNVTTFAEIKDAIDAGRTIMLKNESEYVCILSYVGDSSIAFSLSSGEECLIKTYWVYDDDSWEDLSIYSIESQNNRVQSISSSSDN